MTDQQPTIRIMFHDLAVLKRHDNRRYPLAMLAPGDHIHGQLRIQIHKRVVPHMGYWGPNDVCFAQWTQELTAVRKVFRGTAQGSYTFDEGEQGQPAFVFRRDGEVMRLSIAASAISDGRADPAWQAVAFQYRDFVQAYVAFKQAFLTEIAMVVPAMRAHWAHLFE